MSSNLIVLSSSSRPLRRLFFFSSKFHPFTNFHPLHYRSKFGSSDCKFGSDFSDCSRVALDRPPTSLARSSPLFRFRTCITKTTAEGKDYCDRKNNLLKSNYDQLLEVSFDDTSRIFIY